LSFEPADSGIAVARNRRDFHREPKL